MKFGSSGAIRRYRARGWGRRSRRGGNAAVPTEGQAVE